MDLTSLTNARSGLAPGGYDNPMVETVVAFDEHGRPFYTTVPAPSRVPAHTPEPYAPAGQAPGPVTAYQVQPYYAPPVASAPYSPVRDPVVCRLLAGTVAVVGGAFALSFALAALAAAETALGFLLGSLALLWLLTSAKSGSDRAVNVHITNTNTSRRRR